MQLPLEVKSHASATSARQSSAAIVWSSCSNHIRVTCWEGSWHLLYKRSVFGGIGMTVAHPGDYNVVSAVVTSGG